jgi:hypothetical protein
MTMTTATLRSAFGTATPLAVDLAIAEVNLAALRARRGIQPDEDALTSVRLLRDFASRELNDATDEEPVIPEKMVEDKETREVLQRGLASMSRHKPSLDEDRAQLMRQLVALLSTIAETAKCTSDQAIELHRLLRSLEPKPAPRPSNPRLAWLSGSFDAIS